MFPGLFEKAQFALARHDDRWLQCQGGVEAGAGRRAAGQAGDVEPAQVIGQILGGDAAERRQSQWLHAGLSDAGLATVLLETRHVKAALSAMVVKTDRKDARGIAHLLRMGWYRPVHRKSADA
jgi:hypothetical protein